MDVLWYFKYTFFIFIFYQRHYFIDSSAYPDLHKQIIQTIELIWDFLVVSRLCWWCVPLVMNIAQCSVNIWELHIKDSDWGLPHQMKLPGMQPVSLAKTTSTITLTSLGLSICRYAQNIHVNTLRPRRNEQHFADKISKHIFFNENVWISIKISLKFVPKGPINNIPALVQIMAWRRPDDKPLSEPRMVRLPTHIWVTRPQWVNILKPRWNGWNSAADIFKCIFLNENV